MDRVKGKVAVITGGGSGIGRAAALLLASEGAAVAVTDVNEKGGSEVVEEIIKGGGKAGFWKMDVTSEADIKTAFEDISKTLGNINVLVNNAGIGGASKPVDQLTEAEWDLVMSINVKGVFLCTKHAIAYMRKAGSGSIINISSIYGLVGAPDAPPYHASKGAVRLMSKTDAMFYAAEKIRVNSVHPGFIRTPLVLGAARASGDAEGMLNYLTSLHPVGYLGEPEDIAYGILYLASDESRFMTGAELVIDGGYTAR